MLLHGVTARSLFTAFTDGVLDHQRVARTARLAVRHVCLACREFVRVRVRKGWVELRSEEKLSRSRFASVTSLLPRSCAISLAIVVRCCSEHWCAARCFSFGRLAERSLSGKSKKRSRSRGHGLRSWLASRKQCRRVGRDLLFITTASLWVLESSLMDARQL